MNRRPEQRVPTLGEAMRQRVRIFGLRVPAWSIVAVVVGAAVLAGISVQARRVPMPEAAVPTASAEKPVASAAASRPAVTSSGSVSLVDRARQGELIALKQLERHPGAQRPLEETMALAAGHAELKRADLAALVRDVQADPSLLDDVNTVRALHDHASDPEVAMQALEAIARFEHPIGPDLLFDIWMEGHHDASRELAESLIHNGGVRERATPALELVLALLETKNCRKLVGHLANAVEYADRRARVALQQLERRNGCGPNQEEDCFPCLREPDVDKQLREAIEKVRARPAPTPWRSRKVQDF